MTEQDGVFVRWTLNSILYAGVGSFVGMMASLALRCSVLEVRRLALSAHTTGAGGRARRRVDELGGRGDGGRRLGGFVR
ncbi:MULTISPECIES: hypothetical protein [unclassified Rathayibacter]|uniref:hypothetical protein n=1 Tax=unclassified Rathayibacter TaxID=2609250 RepID=UPI000F4C8618|nr:MULTISPECIES: hypothetical protein [unclassified Rathayibacter]